MAECHRRLNQYAQLPRHTRTPSATNTPIPQCFCCSRRCGRRPQLPAAMRNYEGVSEPAPRRRHGPGRTQRLKNRTAEGRNHTICGEKRQTLQLAAQRLFAHVFPPEANSTSCTSPPLPKKQPRKEKRNHRMKKGDIWFATKTNAANGNAPNRSRVN